MKHPDMVQTDPEKMPMIDGKPVKRLRMETCETHNAHWAVEIVFADDTTRSVARGCPLCAVIDNT